MNYNCHKLKSPAKMFTIEAQTIFYVFIWIIPVFSAEDPKCGYMVKQANSTVVNT